MSVRGWVQSAAWRDQGSELTVAAPSGATVLTVEDITDFDGDGGTLEINGQRVDYTAVDDDLDTVTLVAGLTVAAAVDDRVAVVTGGQVARDYVAFVDHGPGDPAEVVIPFGDRDLWPEGDYDDPVQVLLSDDLERIEEVPGRTPERDGKFIANLGIATSDGTLTTEPTSGTSLPASWTSTKTGVSGTGAAVGSLPGVSVIASGAPAGASGSTLLIDYGAAGQSYTALAGSGYVDTNLDAADALVSMRYRLSVNLDPIGRDAEFRVFIREAGTPWTGDADGIFLDLATNAPVVNALINGSVSTLVALPALVDPTAQWHQAEFQIRAGLVQARVWPEGDPVPAWTTVDQAGILSPGGIGIAWQEFPFLGPSSGQRAYIDQFDVTTYPTGFLVNPDGTGSWPAIEEPLRARLTLLEEKSQAGKVSTGTFAAVNTPQSVAVVFDQPFASPPAVCVSALITNPQFASVSYSAPTTTGFTVWAARSSGSAAFTVAWHAHLVAP